MDKNLIPIIAKELGVEIGEKFKVTDYEEEVRFLFNDDGLLAGYDNSEQSYAFCMDVLIDLIYGDRKVIKLPFEPKNGESYWTYGLFSKDFKLYAGCWGDYTKDYLRKNCGCVFRTEEEAIKARPAKYKELTGKEWECDDE